MTTLAFDILWRDHGAQKGMRDLGNETDKTKRRFDMFRGAATAVGVVAAAGIVKFGKDSVKAFADASKAQAELGFAFQKFPKLADTNQAALQRLNGELQKKTRFDDDNIASGQAVLAQFNLTGKQITAVTPLLADYAAKTGKDIPAAARDVGKALLGNTKALKNIGIDYKSTGDASKDFANVTTLMRKQIGGFAEAEGKTASGRLEILKNQFGELQEAAGAKLLPALSSLVGGLTKLVMFTGDNSRVIVPLVATIGGLAGAIWLADKATAAWAVTQKVLGPVFGAASAKLKTFEAATTGAGARVAGMTSRIGAAAAFLGGPWGIAIGAGVAALVFFARRQGEAAKETRAFTDSLTFQNGALDENSRQTVAAKLAKDGILDAAARAGVAEKSFTDALLNGGQARADMIAQLQQVARDHTTATLTGAGYKETTDQIGEAALKAAEELQRTGGALDASARAAGQADRALNGAAGATNLYAEGVKQLRAAQRTLNTELQKSIDKFTILREGALSVERADQAWEQALDDVTASAKDNGRSLDIHSEKGRRNRQAIINMMTALNDKVTADVKSANATRKGESATDRYSRVLRVATTDTKKGEAQIRAAARAAGYNTEQVDAMIRKYLKTPKKVATDITQPGIAAAKRNADDLIAKYGNLPKYITTKINFDTAVDGFNTKLTYRYGKGARLMSAGGPDGRISSAPLVAPGPASGGPSSSALGTVHSEGARTTVRHGTDATAALLKQLAPSLGLGAGAPGGQVGVTSRGMAATIAAMQARGARSFTTYPGHHPSAAKARDVTPHSWDIANAARASSSVWYVIYRMMIASKNHGNVWRPYRPTNFRGDWQHVRHVHVGWYDRGGITRDLHAGGRPERVLSPVQTRAFEHMVRVMDRTGGVRNTTIVCQFPNYVGDKADLKRALVDMSRRGDLKVILSR